MRVTLHPCPRNHEDHEKSEDHEAKIMRFARAARRRFAAVADR